jgi:phosphatidylinositol alpha-1,6-mannosyltransferase
VFANSRFTKKLLIQAGADADKIDIIHPGCDVERFRPLDTTIEFRRHLLGQRYRDQVILTVGNLVSRKGHDMVIRALSKLRDRLPNVTYLIVGDGPYRDQIEKVSKDVGVRDHVVFAGQIPSEDLPHVYAISDVFAMPSRDQSEACDVEGFGLVFLEANACGKPVIGGRCGGMPDAIVDGVTGFLVNPEDPEDIAIALRRLLTDSNLANRLGRQGYSRVVRDFTWPQVGTRVQGILDSIGKSNVI